MNMQEVILPESARSSHPSTAPIFPLSFARTGLMELSWLRAGVCGARNGLSMNIQTR